MKALRNLSSLGCHVRLCAVLNSSHFQKKKFQISNPNYFMDICWHFLSSWCFYRVSVHFIYMPVWVRKEFFPRLEWRSISDFTGKNPLPGITMVLSFRKFSRILAIPLISPDLLAALYHLHLLIILSYKLYAVTKN